MFCYSNYLEIQYSLKKTVKTVCSDCVVVLQNGTRFVLGTCSSALPYVKLTENEIPGANLDELLHNHSMPSL